jgi:hypothetical protein
MKIQEIEAHAKTSDRPEPEQPVTKRPAKDSTSKPDPLIVDFRQRFDAFAEEARSAFKTADNRVPTRKMMNDKRESVEDSLSRLPDAPGGREDLRAILDECRKVTVSVSFLCELAKLRDEFEQLGSTDDFLKLVSKMQERATAELEKLADLKRRVKEITDE